MKGFCPLASGSKGNCTYLGTDETKILIDAGISTKQIREKLAQIGVDLADIDAILVTHEHADHIQGLKVLTKKHPIPILANQETAKGILTQLETTPKFKIFTTGETFEFGDLEIHPFRIQHDTFDPVAFTINWNQIKMGFCTDLGMVTSLVKHQLKNCDYLLLEANHQPSMVHACSRPMVYKQRVLGRTGHLSNEACANLLQEIAHEKLKHVHLAHLSEECNSPEVALSVIQETIEKIGISVDLSIAHQREISKAILF